MSPKELVAVPDVISLSEGKAREDISDRGLVVDRVEMDSVRTPYENTVTRQSPTNGSSVPVGTRVTLWISPGVENGRNVRVPNVVGSSVSDARRQIREAELWVDSPPRGDGRGDSAKPLGGRDAEPGPGSPDLHGQRRVNVLDLDSRSKQPNVEVVLDVVGAVRHERASLTRLRRRSGRRGGQRRARCAWSG